MPLTVPPGLTSPLSADLDFNSHKGTNVTDPSSAQDASTKNYVDSSIAAISQNTGSYVISGCGVAWSGTGLQFIVSAGTYSINSTSYSVGQTTVTLDAADGSNPRIDLIIATSSSTFDKITGTPAANPVAPSVDPATQLQLTFVYVAAGATTPGVTSTLLYDENVGAATEWNATSSGSTWALGSTNNPYSGSKDIEATSVGTGAYAQLQKGSGTLDPSTQNSFVFYIRSKAQWGNNRSLTIALLNAGVQQGNAISLRDGVYGFTSSQTTSYQQIVIPITAFAVGSAAINQARFIVAGTGGSIGFYLDLITFQAGINTSTQNFVVNRGAWVSAAAYAKNDLVVDGNRPWLTLIANTNSRPSDSNTNWQSLSDPSDQIVLAVNRVIPANSSGVYASSLTIPAGISITIPATSSIEILGPSQSSSPVTTLKTLNDFITSSASLVDVTGLIFAAAANKTYEIDAILLGNTSSSGGTQFAIAYSGTMATNSTYSIVSHTSATTHTASGAVIGTASPTAFWTAPNQESVAKMWSLIRTSTSGNISIKILTNAVSGQLSTIRKGSRLTIATLV